MDQRQQTGMYAPGKDRPGYLAIRSAWADLFIFRKLLPVTLVDSILCLESDVACLRVYFWLFRGPWSILIALDLAAKASTCVIVSRRSGSICGTTGVACRISSEDCCYRRVKYHRGVRALCKYRHSRLQLARFASVTADNRRKDTGQYLSCK